VKPGVVVEDVVGGQLVEVGEQPEPVVSLDVVEAVREDLQQRVEHAPGLLGEHLRQELFPGSIRTPTKYPKLTDSTKIPWKCIIMKMSFLFLSTHSQIFICIIVA
jgi:hypothetical protein